MNSIGLLAEQMGLIIKPLAAMVVREVRPTDDDISLHAARKEYGWSWVDSHISEGNLDFRIKGKRRVLSRASLELLRAAESCSGR